MFTKKNVGTACWVYSEFNSFYSLFSGAIQRSVTELRRMRSTNENQIEH